MIFAGDSTGGGATGQMRSSGSEVRTVAFIWLSEISPMTWWNFRFSSSELVERFFPLLAREGESPIKYSGMMVGKMTSNPKE